MIQGALTLENNEKGRPFVGWSVGNFLHEEQHVHGKFYKEVRRQLARSSERKTCLPITVDEVYEAASQLVQQGGG